MTKRVDDADQAMKDSTDGFYLAEKDAAIRGVGDLLGTKQSGMSTMKFADLNLDANMLKLIRKEIENERGDRK